jgi:hypothetical protein
MGRRMYTGPANERERRERYARGDGKEIGMVYGKVKEERECILCHP